MKNLRRSWKLIVLSAFAAIVCTMCFGSWRASAQCPDITFPGPPPVPAVGEIIYPASVAYQNEEAQVTITNLTSYNASEYITVYLMDGTTFSTTSPTALPAHTTNVEYLPSGLTEIPRVTVTITSSLPTPPASEQPLFVSLLTAYNTAQVGQMAATPVIIQPRTDCHDGRLGAGVCPVETGVY